MSDAQRERTQGKGAPFEGSSRGSADAGSVVTSASLSGAPVDAASGAPDYASAADEASLGSDHVPIEEGRDGRPMDESERVAVISGRPDEMPPSAEAAIHVQVVGQTDVGLVREHNEDNYLLADLATGSRDPQTFKEVSSAGLLLAVCDGMGGAAAGEVASQMAVDTLYEMMRRSVPSSDRDALARSLVRSVEEAGSRIFESARADRSRRGMGTTATVAALMDKTLFVGQVGDSRAYVIRSGELKQITKDQSLVNQLIEAGQLTEDEAEAFEHSNIILQALGTTEQVSVDLTFLELRQGDRLLMCSDGLSGLVHGDVIREVLNEISDLDACCERLIELAKAGGGHDNVTVILAEFTGEGLAMPQPTDLVGYQQYPLPLDQDRRAPSPVHSDMPTLAPPSLRAPPPDGQEPGRAPQPASTSSSSAGRIVLFAMLIAGAAGAVYYWMAEREQPARRVDLQHDIVPTPAEESVPKRVEVVVNTDVESGELLVDGESYGAARAGQWTLELPPGPHRLEARAGGSSITSSLVTVREGEPTTVALAMPAGASLLASDAGVAEVAARPVRESSRRHARASSSDAGVSASAGAASSGSERRARRRREAGIIYTPPSTATEAGVAPAAPVSAAALKRDR
ncbi:MAG: serine/threonine phosphatase PrpC, regulation of stationary phase [Myxococcaceae bacterium]|nr:serine/threonine phosphatase PrpC, regulation of stationary phase [Myxococcaceae bacterium]